MGKMRMMTQVEWERQKQRYYDLINESEFDARQKKSLRALWLAQLDEWRTIIIDREKADKRKKQTLRAIPAVIVAFSAIQVALNQLIFVLLITALIAILAAWEAYLATSEGISSVDLQRTMDKADAFDEEGWQLLMQSGVYDGLGQDEAWNRFKLRLSTIITTEPSYNDISIMADDKPSSRLEVDASDLDANDQVSGQAGVN